MKAKRSVSITSFTLILLLPLVSVSTRAQNLYVSNNGNGTIEKFGTNGVGTVFASSGVYNPVGVAFDSSGNLYVANNGYSNIEKFNANGVGTVFASLSSGVYLPIGAGLRHQRQSVRVFDRQ